MKNLWITFALLLFFLACKKDDGPLPGNDVRGKVLYHDQYGKVHLLHLPSGESQFFTTFGQYARWSNKGDKVAIVEGFPQYYLDVLDATGSDTLMKRSLGVEAGGIDWSVDDTEIAFSIFNNNKIRRLNLATIATKDISIPAEYVTNGGLDWSAAAKAFVFRARRPSNDEIVICRVDEDGSNFKVLVSGENYEHPVFSPDGKSIALTETLTDKIYLMDADGANKRLFWEKAFSPKWSKDGSIIMANFVKSVGWIDSEIEIRAKEVGGKQREALLKESYASMLDWYAE